MHFPFGHELKPNDGIENEAGQMSSHRSEAEVSRLELVSWPQIPNITKPSPKIVIFRAVWDTGFRLD